MIDAKALRAELQELELRRRDLRQKLAGLGQEDPADQTMMVVADWVSEDVYPRLRSLVLELELREALPVGHAFLLEPTDTVLLVNELDVSREWKQIEHVDSDSHGFVQGRYVSVGRDDSFRALVTHPAIAQRVTDAYRAGREVTIADERTPHSAYRVLLSDVRVQYRPHPDAPEAPETWVRLPDRTGAGFVKFDLQGHITRWPEPISRERRALWIEAESTFDDRYPLVPYEGLTRREGDEEG